MQIQPYLLFEGRCAEAIAFYQSAVGAEVQMLMHYKDAPPDEQSKMPPGAGDKVMHANLKIGDSYILVSDGRNTGNPQFGGFSLSLAVNSAAEADRTFTSLQVGGQVVMPLSETFFASRFGMLTDRFGIMWMVVLEN